LAVRLPGLEIVYRELLHIGRVGKTPIAEIVKARHEPLADELVESLTRLPKIDHAPAAFSCVPPANSSLIPTAILGPLFEDVQPPYSFVGALTVQPVQPRRETGCVPIQSATRPPRARRFPAGAPWEVT
jgi:hypothetical protein